jgi:cytochrome c oxidase subunit 3
MEAVLFREDLERREETARLGLWMFLGTVTMLFAAFTSAYVVRRAGSDWQPIVLPSALWVSTATLALSSGALELGCQWGQHGLWKRSSAAMIAAAALGAAFLAWQAMAWRALMSIGVYLPASPHSSFFFMLTGAHAVHVVAALAVLLRAAAQTVGGIGWRQQRRWRSAMSAARTFWHFLLVVWLYLFALISLL